MIKKIKNNDSETHTWVGQEIQAGQYYQIQPLEEMAWANDSSLLSDIGSGIAIVNDGSSDITDINEAINYLKGDVPKEVIPKPPANDHTLKPLGIIKGKITASDYACDISLSNKSGQTFDYDSPSEPSLTPEVGGLIFQGEEHGHITAVDTTEKTLTVDNPKITAGDGILSNSFDIEYVTPGIPTDGFWYLWGIIFTFDNYGEDDIIRIRITDPNNYLGYGAGTILKEYDECWVKAMDKCGKMMTPDGAPGEINRGLGIRITFNTMKLLSEDVSAWVDLIITEQS